MMSFKLQIAYGKVGGRVEKRAGKSAKTRFEVEVRRGEERKGGREAGNACRCDNSAW
jgi:hypothetical protein